MATPYVGEIRMFAGNFAPAGWAFCQGQIMAIAENPVLFQLIGTTYGGDGQVTFALPNLQSRVPVHVGTQAGTTYVLGESGGAETVTLTLQQIPAHSHVPQGNTAPTASSPSGNLWAGGVTNSYAAPPTSASMAPEAVGSSGGSQPHDNMLPYLVINFIISLFGVFPSQN